MRRQSICSYLVDNMLALSIGAVTFASLPLLASAAATAGTNHLQADTVNAWDEYVRSADEHLKARLDGQLPFLWTDESADRRRRIARGEILVAPGFADGSRRVPHGLIHHWIGGIFIEGATIDTLSTVMGNYGSYKTFYQPAVVDSKLLNSSGNEQDFWLLWQHKVLFMNAAMDGRYHSRHIRIDSHRGYNVSKSIQLQEIENYGRPGQRLLPPGSGDGYIWRLYSIARFVERDGGVNFELEAMALSRDIPTSVRWLANPIINRISISSMITTLQQTRDALH